MPNIRSAKKRVKVGAVKKAQNQIVKSVMRTYIKKVDVAVADGDREAANSVYSVAVSMIDKAARKNVIHKNNAAHKKSRLARQMATFA